MPVEAQTVEYSYLGDGVSTVFEFPSRFLSNADLFVALNGVLQVAGFVITGAGTDNGGEVTFTIPPGNLVRVMIVRNPSPSQLIDFENGQTVLEGTLDNALDKLTMIAQYLLRSVRRSVRIADATYTAEASDLLELPAAAGRGYKLFAFNSNGRAELVDRTPYDNIAAATTFSRLYLGEYSFFPSDVDVGFAIQDGALVSIVDQIDPDDNGLYVRDNGLWRLASVLPAGVQRRGFYVVPTDGLTSVPVSGNYVVGQIDVFLNGLRVRLGPSPGVGDNSVPGATASDNANIVFPAGLLAAGDLVEWIVTRAFSVATIAAVDTALVPTGAVAATNVQDAVAELDAEKVPTTRSIGVSGLATGGGSLTADRTIGVPAASQSEAEACIDNTVAMTPLRTGQAIDAKFAGVGVEGREFGVTAVVAASALTVALKKPDLSGDATPAAPLTFAFRDPTLASGGVTKRLLTGALSLTISSGSTMGVTTNNAAFRLWLVLFDDAGTLRLGLTNARSDGAVKYIAPIRPQTVASSTAESGGGTADSPGVFYTSTAVAAKTYIVLASLDWDSGLPAVGAWTLAPTRITPWTAGQPLPGDTLQTLFVNNAAGGANSTTTYAIPSGALLVMSLIRPQNAVKIRATAAGFVTATATATNPNLQATLFRNAVDLLCVRTAGLSSGSGGINLNVNDSIAMDFVDYPLSTAAQTYSYQHKSTVSGINISSSNICITLEEICA